MEDKPKSHPLGTQALFEHVQCGPYIKCNNCGGVAATSNYSPLQFASKIASEGWIVRGPREFPEVVCPGCKHRGGFHCAMCGCHESERETCLRRACPFNPEGEDINGGR